MFNNQMQIKRCQRKAKHILAVFLNAIKVTHHTKHLSLQNTIKVTQQVMLHTCSCWNPGESWCHCCSCQQAFHRRCLTDCQRWLAGETLSVAAASCSVCGCLDATTSGQVEGNSPRLENSTGNNTMTVCTLNKISLRPIFFS